MATGWFDNLNAGGSKPMNGTELNDYVDADNYLDMGGPISTIPVFLVGSLVFTHIYTYTDQKWVGMDSTIADGLVTYLATVTNMQSVRKARIGGGGFDVLATIMTYSGSAPP